jgi:hypothetical protein
LKVLIYFCVCHSEEYTEDKSLGTSGGRLGPG